MNSFSIHQTEIDWLRANDKKLFALGFNFTMAYSALTLSKGCDVCATLKEFENLCNEHCVWFTGKEYKHKEKLFPQKVYPRIGIVNTYWWLFDSAGNSFMARFLTEVGFSTTTDECNLVRRYSVCARAFTLFDNDENLLPAYQKFIPVVLDPKCSDNGIDDADRLRIAKNLLLRSSGIIRPPEQYYKIKIQY